MAAMADVQRQGFDERIKRIRMGGPNTIGTIYVGPVDPDEKPAKSRRQRLARVGAAGGSVLGALFMWPFALLMGAVAMFAGRVAAFQISLRPELVPPQYAEIAPLVADVGIAAVLMIALGWAFSLGAGFRRVFLAAGLVGVMMGEALIIQQAPELFVPLFSENYVAAQLAGTAPIETVPETLEAFSRNKVLLPASVFPGF